MASLREVKNRISSVKSTRQITSAMKMVASAKLHKAQARIEHMLPYQGKLNGILSNFLDAEGSAYMSVYTTQRKLGKVAIVVCASNASLCGAYNSNVTKMLERTLAGYADLGKENISIYPVGKKIEEAVKKLGFASQGSFQTLADKPSYAEAQALASTLVNAFVSGEVHQVELIYHHFKSMGHQVLTRETYLPISLDAMIEAGRGEKVAVNEYSKDYIVEPSADELMAILLPKVLSLKIYTVLLDANASEHAARMLAMQAATDNANELIQDLTKQYNKSRQQAITNELLDIIGGSMK